MGRVDYLYAVRAIKNTVFHMLYGTRYFYW